MAIERERKFLVNSKKLPRKLPKGDLYTQGYLSVNPSVRIRIIQHGNKHQAFMTIKSQGKDIRSEFEYQIPHADAFDMLHLCGCKILQKVRRKIGRWELDEYLGIYKGLWIAEYELGLNEEIPTIPKWIHSEVTGVEEYKNEILAKEIVKMMKKSSS